MSSLSGRLKIIADFVPKGRSVCDVGTDHGYLPAALSLSGEFKSVTATDIREKPLKNARDNLEKCGAGDVRLILCDGLEAVPFESAEVVIIAGMGGEAISGIIDRCPYKEKPLYILQPMTKADFLRSYLANGGFDVIKEVAVSENDRVYSVMVCRFDGEMRSLSPAQSRIGRLLPTTPENARYIQKQLAVIEKCIRDLEASGADARLLDENIAAKREILKITGG